MSSEIAKELVLKFYQYFNETKTDELFALFDDNFVHEFNYRKTHGKGALINHINHSYTHYDEKIHDLIIMVSDDGKHITTKFVARGIYKVTDDSLIPANNQEYRIDVINYIEIDNGTITRGQCYFDEAMLEAQLKGECVEIGCA